ncbi:hypothetical protein FISHEDRAFT_73127 [Fistulina hepatica ATCC 64428]|uniref:Uncharacterized protein n=1 Tax=Fistulina hepatica ATCC 64428 TaxID=1128425 RepID=A0A0D7AE41_9AGAR|nr:hypothetical protein FISHEDRAFT_73127 [Fistulina hepatica ATCC 64428]
MSKGKVGSMHVLTKTVFSGNSVVGAGVPLGAGIAFWAKYQNPNAVKLIFMATERRIRGRFLRRLTWRDYGTCLAYLCAGTTDMEWEHEYVLVRRLKLNPRTSTERSSANPLF